MSFYWKVRTDKKYTLQQWLFIEKWERNMALKKQKQLLACNSGEKNTATQTFTPSRLKKNWKNRGGEGQWSVLENNECCQNGWEQMMQQEWSRLTAVREPEPNVGQSAPCRSTPKGLPLAAGNGVAFCGQLHWGVGDQETPAWHLARLQLGSKASLWSVRMVGRQGTGCWHHNFSIFSNKRKRIFFVWM